MGTKRISEFPAASNLTGFEFLGDQSGTTKRAGKALLDGLYQPLDAQLTELAGLPSVTGLGTLAALTSDQIENLTGLAALGDTPSLVEQTGDGTFTSRLIGVSASTSIPARSDVDGRHALHLNNIASLKALTSANFGGSRVVTRGYYDASSYADGFIKGGGTFWHDSTDTTTADNDVTVIVDSSSRRWKLIHNGVVKASQCGCKIDGSADDLTPLNRGMSLLNSGTSGVRTLYSDPGSLMLSDSPSTLTLPNRAIIGDGFDVSKWTMLSSATTNGTFITIYTSRITISGLGLENDNASSLTGGEPAILIRNGSMHVIEKIRATGCNTFLQMGNTPAATTITGATKANPVVITSASHGYSTGDKVYIASVSGMTQLNGNQYKIVVINANSYSLQTTAAVPVDIDGSAYGAYVSGGTATRVETAQRVFVNNCHLQPTIYDGAHLINIVSGAALLMTNVFASDAFSTAKNSSAVVNIEPNLSGDGIDNIQIANCTFNFNPANIGYCLKADATNPGISNVTVTNSVLDGGAVAGVLLKIPALAGSSTRRIQNFRLVSNRITPSTEVQGASHEGGYGIRIQQDTNNFITGLRIANNVIACGAFEAIKHTAAVTISNGYLQAGIIGNEFNNAYTNKDTLGTTRPVIHIEADGFVISGNTAGNTNATVAGTTGAPFFTDFVNINKASAYSNVVTGNNAWLVSSKYPVNVGTLGAAQLSAGPQVASTGSYSDNPRRYAGTTDATVTTIASDSITNGTTVRYVGRVNSVQSDDTNRAAFTFDVMASAAAGAATIAAGGTATVIHRSNASWAVTIDTSSSSVRWRVTGVVGASIDWYLYIDRIEVIG